jgi:16S rRNA (cytosine967-C5)-methyltransferase
MSSERRDEHPAACVPGASVLAEATRAVFSVAIAGQSSDKALAPFQKSPQRAAIRAIAFGTLRWYLRVMPAIETLTARPAKLEGEVRCLLAVGAHQVEYSRHAPEVTVHRCVEAARLLGSPHACGFVNAVLRRFVAERTVLLTRGDENLAVRSAHPAWLADEIVRAWPDEAMSILAANNDPAPMVLRVDLSRTSVSDYVQELAAAGIAAQRFGWCASAIRLAEPVGVEALPGFFEGRVSVQDAGAQLAAPLLDARSGMRVLDACAAPGGKTGHLLELTPDLDRLVAVDIDAGRSERIRETLARLSRRATVVVGDMRQPRGFTEEDLFHRILVDAPCSATGVIRRHPDIKLLRRADDIARFARSQLQILGGAFEILADGGRLLYSTCSVLPAENEEVVRRFLGAESRARAVPVAPPLGWPPGATERVVGVQLLPGAPAGTDGFYYACIEKTAVGT